MNFLKNQYNNDKKSQKIDNAYTGPDINNFKSENDKTLKKTDKKNSKKQISKPEPTKIKPTDKYDEKKNSNISPRPNYRKMSKKNLSVSMKVMKKDQLAPDIVTPRTSQKIRDPTPRNLLKISHNFLNTKNNDEKKNGDKPKVERKRSILKQTNFNRSRASSVLSFDQDVPKIEKNRYMKEKFIRTSNTFQVHNRRSSILSENRNMRPMDTPRHNNRMGSVKSFTNNKTNENDRNNRSFAFSQSKLSENSQFSPKIKSKKADYNKTILNKKKNKNFTQIKIGNHGTSKNKTIAIKNPKLIKANTGNNCHLEKFG